MGTRSVTINKQRPGPDFPIARDIFIPLVNEMTLRTKSTIENFQEEEWEEIRLRCGPVYATASIDAMRGQASNLRKAGKLRRADGHPPGKRKPDKEKWAAYKRTPHFAKVTAGVIALHGKRCRLCGYNPAEPGRRRDLEIHYASYKNLGNLEAEINDCIPVCKPCEKRNQDAANRRNAGGDEADIP